MKIKRKKMKFVKQNKIDKTTDMMGETFSKEARVEVKNKLKEKE